MLRTALPKSDPTRAQNVKQKIIQIWRINEKPIVNNWVRLVQKFVGSQPDRVTTIWLIDIHACNPNKRLYNQQLMFIGSNRWQSE